MLRYPCLSRKKIGAVAIVLIAPLFIYAQTASKDSLEILADSVTEYSNVQGENGWQYGYWDRSMDADDKYDSFSDFVLFKQFGKDLKNGLHRHEAFETGDLWFGEDGRYYTSLWAKGGHANSRAKLGDHAATEQWAVRRWISETAGTITITGHVGKVMPWGANWSGECQGLIIVDGETVLSTVMYEHGVDYTIACKVKKKSTVDFLIAPNPSIGVVDFTATISKRP